MNPNELDAFREEGIKRFEHIKRKGYDTPLSGEQMYSVLYEKEARILCVISLEETVVGMLVLSEGFDLMRYKKILSVDMCEVDTVPGILRAVESEIDRIAALDSFDAVQFQFSRKGWAKKMKMMPEKGYKILNSTAEKSYGW